MESGGTRVKWGSNSEKARLDIQKSCCISKQQILHLKKVMLCVRIGCKQ